MRARISVLPVRAEVCLREARSTHVLPAKGAAKWGRRMGKCDSLRPALNVVAAVRWANSVLSVTERGAFEKLRIWKSKFLPVFKRVREYVSRAREMLAF